MGFGINTNLLSLNAQRHLAETDEALRTAFERLSSGLRINHASDDPAGLAIADRLKRDQRVAAQGIRNANDGISLLSLGDQALGQITDIVARLSELASESASGTLTNTERADLQVEFAQLVAEVGRIATTTTFNGVALLAGATTISIQVGLDGTAASRVDVGTVDATPAALFGGTLSVATAAGAQSALGVLTTAVQTVASARAGFGAGESRLLTAISTLRVAAESYAQAESRIRDADIAAETAALTRAQILQSAGTAVLAQANQQPAFALQLLR
ncbi:MAG TPA: flagellin [Candidatus Eisenbacteria bacterium]|nr:flagellin [Candidatus Eisenbacteria bacterium]